MEQIGYPCIILKAQVSCCFTDVPAYLLLIPEPGVFCQQRAKRSDSVRKGAGREPAVCFLEKQRQVRGVNELTCVDRQPAVFLSCQLCADNSGRL